MIGISAQAERNALTPAPKHDRTQTRRQARRRQSLDEIAQAHGFSSWSKLETAVLNGSVITITHPGN